MPTSDSQSKPLVFAIDDDALILRYLGIALERAGYRSEGLDDPRRAVAEIKAQDPDLILLDVRLPGVDGFDLYRQIREVSSRPVIFFTASSRTEERDQAMKLGASGFLVKPFSPPEVLKAIEAALAT